MNTPSAKKHGYERAGRSSVALQRIAVAVLFIAVAILVSDSPALAQCAMCQGASAAGSDGGAVYNRSTLFMLCVPYLLLGGVAGYVVYAFRRARPANRTGDPIAAPPAPGVGSAGNSFTPHPGSTAAADDSEREPG